MDIQAVEKLVELIKVTDDKEVREILLCGLEKQLSISDPKPGVAYPYSSFGTTTAIPCGA
jgi:hypothetical protein